MRGCDGFVGAALKTSEGGSMRMLSTYLREEFRRNLFHEIRGTHRLASP